MKVTRSQRFLNEGSTAESLVIEVIARSHSIINALLLDAKRMYQAEEEHRVGIYLPDELVG
jgi:chaperone BCS1